MKFKLILAVLTAAIVLTGCGSSKETEETELTELSQLEDGSFYVFHDGAYKPLYLNDSSFALKNFPKRTGDSYTLYYTDDFEKIPTFYSGDQLIYCTGGVLDEDFDFMRWEDLGWTFGISGLAETPSGRYSVSTMEKSLLVNNHSDASKLTDLGTSSVIIDRAGGNYIRSGNVTRGGTIRGKSGSLEKGRDYEMEAYVGTYLNTLYIKADTRCLVSMEDFTVNDYSFLRSNILEIHIPDWMKTGYYSVDGMGVFRYVDGSSYNESTDFNERNEIETDMERLSDGTYSVQVGIPGRYRITVKYTKTGTALAPKVILTGKDADLELAVTDIGRMEGECQLAQGTYTLTAGGMEERTFTYSLELLEEIAEEENLPEGAGTTEEEGPDYDEGEVLQ